MRFAYADGTDQKRRVYYRAKNGADWELVFDESKGDPAVEPLGFDRDDERTHTSTVAGAHGIGGLCRWNVAKREKLEMLWSGNEAGIDGARADLRPPRFRCDPHDARPLGDNADRQELARGEAVGEPDAAVSGRGRAHHQQHDATARKSCSSYRAIAIPASSFCTKSASGKATFLFARRPWIKADEMAPMEPIAVKARDGLPLHGYVTRPHGKEDAKHLPLVVFAHGGPYGIRDRWEFDPDVQMLASRGFAVLQLNFRGSGGYGDAFVHAGYREWGAKMQDDVTDATRWAITEGIADPARICIYGASYGGYAALRGATKEPDLYRCAIGYVGVYDLRLMYTRGDIPQSTYGDNYLKLVLGEDESVLWDRSPVAHVDQLKSKVMLIVGGEDNRVPPIQGERLHAALDKAHIAHEWVYERTEGHGFYDEAHRAELLTRIAAFLDANIGKSSGDSPRG